MKDIFKAPAVISKIATMADRTIRLQVDCQEMSADDEAIVLKSRNKIGWFLFGESEITEDDLNDMNLPDYKPIEKKDKTPSQRLRAVLYLLWKQKGQKDIYGQQCDADTYYKQIIESLIGKYKDMLE